MNWNQLKCIWCSLFLIWGSYTYGQQDAQLSMYLRNPVQFNSAHAGTNGSMRTMLINRAQWVGWDGAPRTQFISSHAPVLRNRMGVGITALRDRSGARGHNEFMVHGAYHFPKKIQSFNISTGLSLGVQSNRFDFSDLQVNDINDPLQAMAYKESAFNAGFGCAAHNDVWYFGLAIPHLVEQPMGFQGSGPVQRRHYYLTTAYVKQMNSVLDVRGAVLMKKVSGAPMTADFGVEAWVLDKYSLGAMVRWREGIGFQASYALDDHGSIPYNDQLRVYYAVDFPLNGLANRNFGSHELGISWDFGYRRNAYQSPRYF